MWESARFDFVVNERESWDESRAERMRPAHWIIQPFILRDRRNAKNMFFYFYTCFSPFCLVTRVVNSCGGKVVGFTGMRVTFGTFRIVFAILGCLNYDLEKIKNKLTFLKLKKNIAFWCKNYGEKSLSKSWYHLIERNYLSRFEIRNFKNQK